MDSTELTVEKRPRFSSWKIFSSRYHLNEAHCQVEYRWAAHDPCHLPRRGQIICLLPQVLWLYVGKLPFLEVTPFYEEVAAVHGCHLGNFLLWIF